MCEGGINVDQLKFAIEQADETVALGRRWVHRLYHQADGRGRDDVAAELKAAQALIDRAREHIAGALKAVDGPSDDGVTVELV